MMYTCGREELLLLPWHFQERFYLLKKSGERETEVEIDTRHQRVGPKADFKNTGMIRGKENAMNLLSGPSMIFIPCMLLLTVNLDLSLLPALSEVLLLTSHSKPLVEKWQIRGVCCDLPLLERQNKAQSALLSPSPEPSPGLRGTLFLFSFFSEIGTFTRRSIRRSGAARHWRKRVIFSPWVRTPRDKW